MTAAIRPIPHASSTSSSDIKPNSPTSITFFVRERAGLWQVEESRGWVGGIFVSLRAAARFAREQGGLRARVVILGSGGSTEAEG